MRTPRQTFRNEIQRKTVEPVPKQGRVPNILPTHQKQRTEKVHTKLAVGLPRRSLFVLFKGENIDKDGTAPVHLNIVRRGILQRHAVFQRGLLNFQR